MVQYAVLKLGNHRFRLYVDPKTKEEDPTIVSVVQHEMKVKFIAHLYPDNFVPDPIAFFEKVLDSTTNRDFSMKYKFISEDGDKSTNYTCNHDQLHLTFSDTHRIEFQLSNYEDEREGIMEKMIQMHKMPYQSFDKNYNLDRLNRVIATVEELQAIIVQQAKDNENLREEAKNTKKENETLNDEVNKLKKIVDSLEKKYNEPNNFADTNILNKDHISKLTEWTGRKTWRLIYRGSQNGWSAANFHNCCNNKGESIVVIRSSEGYIFGGYCPVSWTSSNQYINTNNAWLFSMSSPNGTYYVKLPVTQNQGNSIYDHSGYGPTFGSNHDLHINNNPTSNSNYSNLGGSYSYSPLGRQYFTSGQNFIVSEIEVFAL
jgi:regulator of replication initiation timing